MAAPSIYNENTKTGRLKWRPREWRPEYDRMVAYSVIGRANTWIATQLGFTPEHVSTILNMPEAKALKEKLSIKLRNNIEVNIPQVLTEAATKAAQRIKEVLDNDELAAKSPFAVAGLAVDILKGQGNLRGGGNGALTPAGPITNNTTNVILAPAQTESIMAGFKMIAEVQKLHSPAPTPALKDGSNSSK